MNDKKTIMILWTGGFDSTYMMMKYAREDILIVPIYVYRKERLSKDHEIKAMNTLLELLRTDPSTKAYIFDIQIIDENRIAADKEITNAFHHFVDAKIPIGSQYEPLARLAKYNPHLYVGIIKTNDYGLTNMLKEHGKIVYSDDVYYLDAEYTDPYYSALFSNFRFPLLETTEEDILIQIKKWKQEHYLSHIWFCHHPVNNKPCGVCVPCRIKIKNHLEFLFPDEALVRYKEFMKIATESSIEEAKKQKDRLRSTI